MSINLPLNSTRNYNTMIPLDSCIIFFDMFKDMTIHQVNAYKLSNVSEK